MPIFKFVYPSGKVVYRVQAACGGRMKRGVAHDLETAKETERQWFSELQAQKLGITVPTRKMLFEDFALGEYMTWCKINKRSWKRDIQSINFLMPYFKGKYLNQIHPADVISYMNHRKASRFPLPGNHRGDHPSNSTVNLEINCLSAILRQAILMNFCNDNPCHKVKRFRINNQRTEFLNLKECEALINACQEPFKTVVLMGILTGARIAEVLNSRWQDMDMVHGIWTIPASMAKSGHSRTIPIAPRLLEAIKILPHDKGAEFLFHHPDGKPFNKVSKSLASALKRAGIFSPDRRISYHTLRHSFCTLSLLNGVPLHVVKAIAGHSHLSTTLRYAHAGESDLAAGINRLEQCLAGSLPNQWNPINQTNL